MSVHVSWLGADKTCLHIVVEGRWMVEAWLAAIERAGHLAQQVTHNVALIVEYDTHAAYVPAQLFQAIPRAAMGYVATSARVAPILVVNENAVMRMVSAMFVRNYGLEAKVQYLDSLEEALQIVRGPAASV